MTFVDHLQGVKATDLLLEAAFGRHVIAGDLTKSIAGSVVQIQHMLGEAYGKGWGGPEGIWFRGVNRVASKYTFHPGIHTPDPVLKTFTADSSTDFITATAHGYNNGDMIIFQPGDLPAPLVTGTIYYVVNKTTNTFQVSTISGGGAINLTTNGSGTLQVFKNDPTQGIDPFFPQDTNHSNTAWIRVECPNGTETGIPDPDTKTNPPTGLSGIYKTQLGDIYDSSGSITSSGQLLTNPADVISFGCMEIRKYPTSRVDWASLATLRTAGNTAVTPDFRTLPQGVGLTASYYDGTTFTTLKSKRTDPVIEYDLSTGAPALDITPTSFSARFEGFIRFKYTETYTLFLTHNDSGKLWVNNLTTPIINNAATAADSATFAATADAYVDIKLEWTNAASDSQFTLEWQSTSQPRQVVPQDRLYPKNETKNRFESHVRFTQPTDFDQFLRSVLFTCNGGYQDVNGKLTFFCIEDLTHSFDFDESNIKKDTFDFYPRFTQQDFLSLPNRFVADGRDLDDRYLAPFDPPLFYDLPALQTIAGRIIEETVNVGNTYRWQGLSNLAFYAKKRTQPLYVEFEGLPQTLPVLPGDIVRVTHSKPGWTNKSFLCVEATDKSIDSDPDERIFKLMNWD